MFTADTAWLLVCTALVIFMTPGLAFFYGGLVKSRSVVSMMMLSFGALGLVGVLWILYGYNMFDLGDSGITKYFANPLSDFGLFDASSDLSEGAEVNVVDVAFGGSFAIITVALISGAIADRARFFPWLLFAGIWASLVYFPVEAWVWNADNGWIYNFGIGTLDWAGGTAVHINAGAAALALAIVLGKRVGFSKDITTSHNVPLVLIGAAILWFGWFGFNTGLHEGTAASAGLIFLNTLGAPAAAMLGWLVVEHFKEGKATAVGAASGIVSGLVAITPACAHLQPFWAIVLGLIAGAVCCFAIEMKFKLGFDDSLDVVGIHLVAGFIGCLYLGFFSFAPATGLFYGGGFDQLWAQLVSSVSVAVYSFVVAFVVGMAIEKTIGFRATVEDEVAGIDPILHGTPGYALD